MKCCICGNEAGKYGNNSDPIAKGQCCVRCNITKVIPARIKKMKEWEKGNRKSGTGD